MRKALKITAVTLAALVALFAGIGAALEYTSDAPAKPLPACQYEDGSGQGPCHWDADRQGNGHGHDVTHKE